MHVRHHSWRHNWKWFSCILAASRMVDHWITNQRAQSGTSSPVRETESITPPAAKKNLKIQTTVSKDKPQTTSSHKTLSQRCVAFFIFYGESWSGISPIFSKQWIFQNESGEIPMCLACSGVLSALELANESQRIKKSGNKNHSYLSLSTLLPTIEIGQIIYFASCANCQSPLSPISFLELL